MGWTDNYKRYDTSNGFGSKREWQKIFKQTLKPEDAKTILEDISPYEILKISTSATQEQIKKAYRTQAFKWHPDINFDNLEEATLKMKQINAAYSILYTS